MRPIAITPGEPAGIGPDIVLQQAMVGFSQPVVAVASLELLKQRAQLLKLDIKLNRVTETDLSDLSPQPGHLNVIDVSLAEPVVAGTLNAANGAYVIQTLDVAIALAQQAKVAAIVTGPVHKGIINESGLNFTGHTEYLRDQTHTEEVVMMLATEGLRVALVTTHLPLKDISAAINQDVIVRITTILHRSLVQYFGCSEPSILVAGLNPHAGEDGHLGMEEIDVIIPALKALSEQGINTTGPLPADTLFQPHYLDKADAVLAMYHDQGLPVLKYKGFGNAVNITLGLPFIRTSVDHGTALDLAGTGNANLGSLRVALDSAWDMAVQQEQNNA